MSKVIIYWVLAWVFSAIQDSINFRPDTCLFSKIKHDKTRKWILGHYKSKIKAKFPYLAPLWDGWHCSKWVKWLLVYVVIYIKNYESNITEPFIFALTGFITFKISYNYIFARETRDE